MSDSQRGGGVKPKHEAHWLLSVLADVIGSAVSCDPLRFATPADWSKEGGGGATGSGGGLLPAPPRPPWGGAVFEGLFLMAAPPSPLPCSAVPQGSRFRDDSRDLFPRGFQAGDGGVRKPVSPEMVDKNKVCRFRVCTCLPEDHRDISASPLFTSLLPFLSRFCGDSPTGVAVGTVWTKKEEEEETSAFLHPP